METLPAQLQDFTLYAAGSSTGDTSLTLTTFTDPLGNLLTMANFGQIGYGTIEPNNGSNEDSIVFTGITQNANGTATLTGVKSVGFTYPYTASSGLRIPHAGSVTFIITNTSYFYYNSFLFSGGTAVINAPYTFNNIVTASGFIVGPLGITSNSGTSTFTAPIIVPTPVISTEAANMGYVTTAINNEDILVVHIAGTETITGAKTFTLAPISSSTPVINNQVANKAYVDSIAFSGSPNASSSAKGIVQLSTPSQTSSGTSTGSSGALLVPPTSLFSSLTTGGTTVVVSKGNGVIDTGYLAISGAASATTFLRGDSAWSAVSVGVNVGVTTHDISITGAQAIPHTLGRNPSLVSINSNVPSDEPNFNGISNSVGAFDGTNTSCIYSLLESSNTGTGNITNQINGNDGSNIIHLVPHTGGGNATATITTSSTNIVLTWSKAFTVTGTANILWEVM